MNDFPQRTPSQNASLHLFCEQLAEAMNEAGISQRIFLKELEVDNSMESVKSVFRELGKVKYGKDSTAKLTTKEMTDIYEELNRHTASRLGIHVPWPSIEEVLLNQNNYDNRKKNN